MILCKSPIKYAGGKASLLPTILEHVPRTINRYYEPFVGGGAVLFGLYNEKRIARVHINDTNQRLMQMYRGLRDADQVLTFLRKHQRNHSENYFLRTRKHSIDGQIDREDPTVIAAWMIYLNKTCFNGLYRVNKKNEFNVPFGHYVSPKICDDDNLFAIEKMLQKVRIRMTHVDFVEALKTTEEGDFVFCDPPYLPRVGHEFVGYGANHFGIADHVRLRDEMKRLKKLGVNIMVTNSGADEIRQLYARGFKIVETPGKRSIGSTGQRRGYVPDVLIT